MPKLNEKEQAIAYKWDRLLRAHARGDSMTHVQKEALRAMVISGDCPADLAKAVDALVAEELTDTMVINGYKRSGADSLNVEEYRLNLAGNAVLVNETDDRIAALMAAATDKD